MELGVFQGQSLAVWTQFFAHAQMIVGMDVFLGNFQDHLASHKAKGAFAKPNWKVQEVDSTNASAVQMLFPLSSTSGSEFDIIIDDGCHHTYCIVDTFRNLRHLISPKGGLYFV